MHASSSPPSDAAPPPGTASSRDGLVALAVAALVVVTVLIGALGPSAHRAPASPAEDVTCMEWSDGCTICQRSRAGMACSLPGIACVQAEARCLRHSGG